MTSVAQNIIDEVLLSACNTMAPQGATSTEELLDILLGPDALITKGYSIELIRESQIDHDEHGKMEARLYGIRPASSQVPTSLMAAFLTKLAQSYSLCIPGQGTSDDVLEKASGAWRNVLGAKNIIPVLAWLVSSIPEAVDWKLRQKKDTA